MSQTNVTTDEALFSTLGDDPDLGELVEMFVDEMPERIATLNELFSQPDRKPLERMAHQLKGAAGGYGFPTISLRAAHLEKAVRDAHDEPHIRQALDDLIDLCLRARAGAPS